MHSPSNNTILICYGMMSCPNDILPAYGAYLLWCLLPYGAYLLWCLFIVVLIAIWCLLPYGAYLLWCLFIVVLIAIWCLFIVTPCLLSGKCSLNTSDEANREPIELFSI